MFCVHCGSELPEGTRVCVKCGRSPVRVVTSSDDGLATFSGGLRLMNGRYEIVCELGRGGMGVVYQAIDHVRDADVALKMLPPQLEGDERAIADLKREVNLALKLTHEHICRVYDFQQCSDGQFISMEYIDGPSLEKLLIRQQEKGCKGFPLEWVLRLLKPVCAAVDYAHGKGIVHRDLKPANIILDSEGTVKITDFGLARAIHSSMSKYSREAVSGTALYMSPEQCRGKPTDARSDVYSLGMMTYELLAGEAPFANATEIIYCQLHEDIDPIGDVPEHVNAALQAATAKQHDKRPEGAGAFLRLLRDEAGRSRGAAPAPPASEPRRPVLAPVTSTGTPKPVESRTFAGIEMVWCPPGEFTMGSPPSEAGRFNNETQHQVTLTKGFWLGKYPISQAQWQAVMGDNPSYFKGEGALPVDTVSWNDCQELIRTLNTQGEGTFRLPTEAEWEYVCRAGSTTAYCFGNDASKLGEYAWYSDNSGSKTHPVGQKGPNAWGLYDMHGNVWEWCEDWYGEYLAGAGDPKGAASGQCRVLRGGSWSGNPWYCRSAYRNSYTPDYRLSSVGFRLLRTP